MAVKKNKYVIGIDESTHQTKAVVIDPHGREIGSGNAGYELIHPKPGYVEQEAEWWWLALKKSINQALQSSGVNPHDIVGLSITHQRYSFVPVDEDMAPIRNAILWSDTRCGPQSEWAADKFGADFIYDRTGYFPFVWAVYKILWIKENEPAVYEGTHQWLLVQDYLVYQLTGEIATTSSSAAMMGCLDIQKRNSWAIDILEKFGLDSDKFVRRIEPAGSVLGNVSDRAGQETGLPSGIPVIAAAGDQPCGCLGAGVYDTGTVGINGGTSCTIQGISEKLPIAAQRSFIIEINPAGKYAPEAAIHSGAATLMKWLKNDILQDASINWENFYNLAGNCAPGNLGMTIVPYFQGVEAPYWDARSRGVIYGLGIDHKKEHFVRGIIEGLAYETRLLIGLMKNSTGLPIENIRMYGGSAQSDVWNRIFADITGCEVIVPENIQTTAIGAAICAAAGVGWYKDIGEAARNMVTIARSYRPDGENKSLYDDLFKQIYQPFYGRVVDLMHNLSAITGYP